MCEPGSAGAGRLLARERANEDGRATTRPHRYGGIFLGWLANAASHPGSCRRCAACSYPPWPSMGRTRFRGRDRRANGRRTCTAERQCNSPSRGFLSIRPGHSLDDDGASGFGRVEVWRSGCRSNISVAASFVWRCLSGSTLAPFPHPAHRTATCGFPASGSRTRLHAFTHGTSRPSAVRRTSLKCP